MSIAAPSSRRRASRKSKKSWRKNVDIADVEDELDDQRLEQRLGGEFSKRRDDELFVIDNNDDNIKKGENEEKNVSRLESKKLKWGKQKPLNCFQSLENSSAIKDPKKGRNRVRTPEERRDPIVKAKELRLAKAGIVKKKVRDARRHRVEQKDVQRKRHEASKKRYRSDFDFDLWSTPTAFESKSKLENLQNNEWVSSNIQTHLRNNMGLKMMKKPPKDLGEKPSKVESVQVPHPGTSYNPSYKDHQELLWQAVQVEVDKEKKKHKIDYHTTRMFPKPSEFGAIHKERVKEMSQGINGLDKSDEKEDDNDINEEDVVNEEGNEDEDASKASSFKLKTKQKRRRLRSSESLLRLKLRLRLKRKQQQDLFRIKSLKRAIMMQEKELEERKAKRKALKEHKKMYETARLGQLEYEEGDLDLKLSDELKPDLRSLTPEGCLLDDRYRSLQRRNVIEPRVKQKRVIKYKRKRVEKRSYKM